MTAIVRATPVLPSSDRAPEPSARSAGSISLFRAGWPFIWFFVGYPVWWVFGLTWLAGLVASGIMVVHLCRSKTTNTPRHFGWWLLFLAWVSAGAFLLQVNAPGAVPGASMTRYLTWGYRLLTFAEATVMLVYLCSMRRALPWPRVARALGWMFVYIVVGGLLGILAPFAHFPSLFELVLPRHIASQAFVSSLVQPNFAQIQEYLGVVTTRPSAPFPYANSWGLNYVCFLPFFIAGWWQRGSRLRRAVSAIVLLASAAPLVLSLNRAVWAVTAVLLVYVAVRGALRGHVRLASGCILVACLAGGALAATPLGATIQSRLSGEEHTSDQGRANLGTLTATSAWDRSAVAGYGTTRDVQGSFQSISIGATPSCPACSGPALGTQGIVWLLIFAFGFGGLLLYLGFLILHFIGSVRSRAPSAMLASTTLLAYLLTTPFYDLSLTSQVAPFAAIAMITIDQTSSVSADIRRYTGLIRRQLLVLVVAVCCGLAIGATWQYRRGTPYVASLSVVIGADSTQRHGPRPMSMDTLAQLATGSEVTSNMLRAADSRHQGSNPTLKVTAAPNSRILQLSVAADSPNKARRAVDAVAQTLLKMRADVLHAQRTTSLQRLDSEDDRLWLAIGSTSDGIRALQGSDFAAPLRNALVARRTSSLETLAENVDERVDVGLEPISAGRVLDPPRLVHDKQPWTVSLVSSALLGLLAGTIGAWLRERRSPRLQTLIKHHASRATLPSVLAEVPSGHGFLSCRDAARSLEQIPFVTLVAVGHSPDSHRAAELIAKRLPNHTPRVSSRPRVALIVDSRCRTSVVRDSEKRLVLQGAEVCGLIVVSHPAKQFGSITHGWTNVRAFTTPSRGSADDECRQQ